MIPLFCPTRAKTRENGAFYGGRPAGKAGKSTGFRESNRYIPICRYDYTIHVLRGQLHYAQRKWGCKRPASKTNKASSKRRGLVLFSSYSAIGCATWTWCRAYCGKRRTQNLTRREIGAAPWFCVDCFFALFRRLFSSFAFASGTCGD